MNPYAADLWRRAKEALSVAESVVALSPDAAASRAYYAAFYAVSALFALEDKTFSKHASVEAAVHRDLVKTGRWEQALGTDYSSLRDLREMGDYGGKEHVTAEEARESILAARRILAAVRDAASEMEP